LKCLGLALLLCASCASSRPTLEPEFEQRCAGVQFDACDIEPAEGCLGSELQKITDNEASSAALEGLLAHMGRGTVSVRRDADGSSVLVPSCRLDGSYHSVLGEQGSGELWVAERVLFAPSEVGASCQDATHSVVALALGPSSSVVDGSSSRRFVALLAPLPCPNVDEKRSAQGCIGKGLNGAARIRRAEDLEQKFRELRSAGGYLAKSFATALDVYALAPDRPGDGSGPPISVEPLRYLEVDSRDSYLHTNSEWVISDLRQQGHSGEPPRFTLSEPPLFLGCFPELFDPAGDAQDQRGGGRCWKAANSELPSARPDSSSSAELVLVAPAARSEPVSMSEKPPLKCGLSLRSPRPGPASPLSQALLAKAKERLRAEDLVAAKTLFEKLCQDDPQNARAHYYLARTLQALGENPRAPETEYEVALAFDKTLTKASVALAKLLFAAGDNEGTLRVADSGLKTAAKEPELLYYRARSLDSLGKEPEALAAYAFAEQAGDGGPKLHAAYGSLLSEAGKHPQALAQLKAALTTSDPALLASVAESFAKEGAFDECIQAMDRALAKENSVTWLVQRAVCKDGNNDGRAEKDYQAALAHYPSLPILSFYYGLHLVAKDKQKALQYLDSAGAIAGERGVGPEARRRAAELRQP
jgi:tetratricopeptide (TPR) repeat protein